MRFKYGDTAECIHPDVAGLTKGQHYGVLRYDEGEGCSGSSVTVLNDFGYAETYHAWSFKLVPTAPKNSSDGGSTDYYKLPAGALDLQDLIEHQDMNFSVGNIFKAAYRLGKKAGTDRAYDLRKIIFFAQRELDLCNGQRANRKEPGSSGAPTAPVQLDLFPGYTHSVH